MKALVISGGGSKGAFAGIAEYLIRDCCISYELFVGVQPAVY
jgi:predicted patatin/cPLA2 family phospholipase